MPLTAGDRVEITELVSRYNQAIDSGDHETWASTFTADGTFNSKSGQASGTDELSQFAKGFSERMPGARHWVNNLVIDGDGDTAELCCYLNLMRGGEVLSSATYNDTLIKQDGNWKFKSRNVS